MKLEIVVHHHHHHHYPELLKVSDQLANIERELAEYQSAAQIAAEALAALRGDVNAKMAQIQEQLAEILALTESNAEYEQFKARIADITTVISDTTDGLLAAAQPPAPAEPDAPAAPEAPAEPAPDAPVTDGQDQGNNPDNPPPPPTPPVEPPTPVDPEDNPEVKTSDKQTGH